MTYDGLPVASGGAHRLGTLGPTEVMRQLSDFLNTCTAPSLPRGAYVEVIAGSGIANELLLSLIKEFTCKYGPPVRRHVGTGNLAHRWSVAPDEVDVHVARIEGMLPLPKHRHGLQLMAVAEQICFRLLHPETRLVLPYQHTAFYGDFSRTPGQLLGRSQLYARISERSTVSLFLSLPFAEVTDEVRALVAFLQAHLPFRLSNAHWKSWRPTKDEKGYTGRRIDVGNPHPSGRRLD